MFMSHVSSRARKAGILALLFAAIGVFAPEASTQGMRFYADDPIRREPESQDASKVSHYDHSQMYELVYNLFINSGRKPSGLRAKNINTIDEVPDSNWFTDRIGARTITNEELARGPNVGAPPDPSKWVLIREKISGVHPGFTAKDGKGETWFLEFDPVHFPEGATAAVAIATKIFWALGYNQVESFVTTFDPRRPRSTRRPLFAGRTARERPLPRTMSTSCSRPARAIRTEPIASSPAACCLARLSGLLCTRARAPTIPTISCRTSTGASCGRCASSARGRTSPTSRPRTRSTRSSPRTAGRSSSTTCRTSAPPLACATTFTSGI